MAEVHQLVQLIGIVNITLIHLMKLGGIAITVVEEYLYVEAGVLILAELGLTLVNA